MNVCNVIICKILEWPNSETPKIVRDMQDL